MAWEFTMECWVFYCFMGLLTLLLKWKSDLIIMSSSIKDFLDKFFDLCREYQQQIPPQKMAEVLREYADRLEGWRIQADLIKDIKEHNSSRNFIQIFLNLKSIFCRYFPGNYF